MPADLSKCEQSKYTLEYLSFSTSNFTEKMADKS
jgi:hypothetical protein